MRNWQSHLARIVIASIVLVSSAAATPPESASGTITLIATTVTSSRQAGPNTIITGENTLGIAGDVSGIATFEFTQVNHADGSVTSTGVATCLCTIDGMSGTVVFGVTGRGSLGPPFTLSGTAVVRSADGGLEGLHGVIDFDQVGPTATYEGRIHIEG
jgi:hypothetical protein